MITIIPIPHHKASIQAVSILPFNSPDVIFSLMCATHELQFYVFCFPLYKYGWFPQMNYQVYQQVLQWPFAMSKMSLQINMSEIVRKYLVFTHSGHFAYFFNIFHIFELYGGLTLFETNIEPLFMPCFLIYSFSILHSFFGKNICLIFPVQCITAGPDYTVSQVTYLISDT